MEAVDLAPEDIAISWLPLYHDMGLIGMWLVPLFSGNPTVIMSPLAFLSRPERWLQAIHRHRGTVSPAPNFAYELCVRRIADKDIEGIDLSCWRAAFNGAETVHASTLDRFTRRFASYGLRRTAAVPVYGLAEATLAVSVPKIGTGYRVDRIDRETFQLEGRAVPATSGDAAQLEFVGSGQPLSNMEVKIISDDGRELADRFEGRLCFRSPSATSGYYHNPKATSALLREDGWLDSGDRAYRVDGEIFITGRAKDLIIKAGRKLYPHEIEDAAGRVTGVRTGCVVAFGAPDERSGTERFIVAAETRAGGDANRISAELSAAVQEAVGVPPDVIELLPPQSIPKTSSGKLRRSETKRLYLAGLLGRKQPPVWAQVARLAVRSAAPRAWNSVGRGARRVVEFLYGLWALLALASFLIPTWVIVSLTPDPKRAARIVHSATRAMLHVAGIGVHFKNGELLAQLAESGPWIFAPNHSSYVDILVLLACLPGDARFVVKGEALQMPIFGRMARRTGQLTFNRSDPQARIRQAEEIDATLARGESVVVYPEGTFTAIAGIRPFQLGAFKAAVDTQRPICPVTSRGAREILRDKTYVPRPGSVTVTLGPLVLPQRVEGDAWPEIVRLRDATREIIARNASEPLL
jgi:fatty-acyl-CoA synthase